MSVSTIGSVDLVLWLIFICVWMYFGLTALMYSFELKISPNSKNAREIVTGIVDLTNPHKNPEGYKSARFHLYGAAVTIPLFMIIMAIRNA